MTGKIRDSNASDSTAAVNVKGRKRAPKKPSYFVPPEDLVAGWIEGGSSRANAERDMAYLLSGGLSARIPEEQAIVDASRKMVKAGPGPSPAALVAFKLLRAAVKKLDAAEKTPKSRK